jgi:hypothetical protein
MGPIGPLGQEMFSMLPISNTAKQVTHGASPCRGSNPRSELREDCGTFALKLCHQLICGRVY